MPDAGRRLLAFDYGLKRIGVASGNGLTRTASPLATLASRAERLWREIDGLMADWQPDLIVVGRPGDDASPALLAALDAFVAELERRYGLAIETVDESYTSTAAAADLRAGRQKGIYNRRLQRELIDRRAACLIAEQWMNQALE